MRPSRFDHFAKRFAVSLPRRRVLSAATVGLASPLLGRTPTAAARCKKPGQGCDRDNDCCKGAECRNDKCKCRDDLTQCGRKCKNLRADEKHCLACENRCPAGQTCCDGCADLQRDRRRCGSCDTRCPANQICFAGVCTACPVGNVVCGNGCCPSAFTCNNGSCIVP